MIGIDAVDVERFRRTMATSPDLEDRLFSSAERAYCHAHSDPFLHLAGTLAAKEAVIKAGRLGSLASWARRIEIERDASGAPRARIHGVRHDPVVVSISHDGPVAVAIALVSNAPSHGDQDSLPPGYRESFEGRLRPNRQLLRYVGLDRPKAPRTLTEGLSSIAGSDFP